MRGSIITKNGRTDVYDILSDITQEALWRGCGAVLWFAGVGGDGDCSGSPLGFRNIFSIFFVGNSSLSVILLKKEHLKGFHEIFMKFHVCVCIFLSFF